MALARENGVRVKNQKYETRREKDAQVRRGRASAEKEGEAELTRGRVTRTSHPHKYTLPQMLRYASGETRESLPQGQEQGRQP